MDLLSYLRAIRKGWWIVLITIALGLGLAVLQNARSVRLYASSVTFFVNTAQDSQIGLLQGSQYAQNRVNSYVQLSTSDRLADAVLTDTGVDMSVAKLTGAISAYSPTDTVLLTVDVTDPSPAQSIALSRAIGTEFVALIKTIDPQVRMQLVSGPTLNPVPVSPRTTVNLALGLLLGLVAGILIAILRQSLDNTIRSSEVLSEITGAPVLGTIRFDPDARKHPILVPGAKRSHRSEAYRQLRTNLNFVQARVIVVSSSVSSEGKSSLSANLAVTFAQSGQQVLIIEADMRRPRVSDYLGMERGAGLSNVLAGQVDLVDVLQTWGDPSFHLLASGPTPPNPSELIGGPAMARLIADVRSRFDLVIIDTPPILPVTDAAAVTPFADGVLLVTRAGKTRKQQVAGAVRALSTVDARIIGAVLNMSKGGGATTYSEEYYDSPTGESDRRAARAEAAAARDKSWIR